MAGVVLETLSNRKLIILGISVLILQLAFFLFGGLIAPAPSNAQQILGSLCIDKGNHRHKQKWFYSRGEGSCDRIDSFEDSKVDSYQIDANEVVFTFQFPLPRDGAELDMSRWFQNIISVLQIDITHDPKVPQGSNPLLTMDARLGYRNKHDGPGNWTEIARSTEERTLTCETKNVKEGYLLDCDVLPFFESGSCHHDYYLVNIRIPVHDHGNMNEQIGKVTDMTLVAIHQNGGFTKVWLAMKTVVFPVIVGLMIWFWRRVMIADRSPVLLEKTLLCLGLALTLLNLPIEWFTLWIYMPYMLLFTDIRQGIFYSMLMAFWIIFAGEHMMDQLERNRLVMYWKHLGAVAFGCICLFTFEMCERGVQLTNPFYSIWTTPTGSRVALGFIILAGISACVYFIFLCYMIFKVFRNISSKTTSLPSMSKARRKYYMGLIYRFRFLMVVTLLCAAMTVVFFIISQVSEGQWKWGDAGHLQYTSAFFTGVYGMWNIYVFSLLILYAPSHKFKDVTEDGDSGSPLGTTEEEQELTSIPSDLASVPGEASVITSFMKKAAAD